MSTEAQIARLTEREKESLRGRLNHQTAKEIALDLGISHHAVEKRLKMARTKLGVATSLEAARLLAEVEGYQRTVTMPADHVSEPSTGHKRARQILLAGGFVMVIGLVLTLVLAAQSDAPTNAAAITAPQPGAVEIVYSPTFDELDQDSSGFLEGEEAPKVVRVVGSPTLERDGEGRTVFSGDSLTLAPAGDRDRFYTAADTDRDGKVSPAEFERWMAHGT